MSRNIKLDGQTINNVSLLKILDADTNEYITYSDKTLMALAEGSLKEITISDIADLDPNKVSLRTLLSMTPELEHLEIPENLVWGYNYDYDTSDNYLYSKVPNLKYVKWNNKDIYKSVFRDLNQLETIENVDQIEQINDYAFRDCYKLNVPLGLMNSLQTYGQYAFANTLTDTTKFPATMTSIPGYSYMGTKITTLTIPEGYTSIDQNAFNNCDLLASVTIPKSMQKIGEYAFAYCDNLATITFNCSCVDKFNKDAFNGLPNLTTVQVPDGSEDIFVAKFPYFADKIQTIALSEVTYTYYVNGEALPQTTTTDKVITSLPEVTPPEGKIVIGWYTDAQFRNKISLPFYANENTNLYVKFGVRDGRSEETAFVVKASEIYNNGDYQSVEFTVSLDQNNEQRSDYDGNSQRPLVYVKIINDLDDKTYETYFYDSSNDGQYKYIYYGYLYDNGRYYNYGSSSVYGDEQFWSYSIDPGKERTYVFWSDTRDSDNYQINDMKLRIGGYFDDYYGGGGKS